MLLRGQMMLEELGPGILAAFVVMAGALVLAGILHATSATNAETTDATLVNTEMLQIHHDNTAAQATFIPALDLADANNSDGHEIDFYRQDEYHVGHFFAYCYRASADDCSPSQPLSTLDVYSYVWTSMPRNGGAAPQITRILGPITGFSSFIAKEYNGASQLATLRDIAGYAAQNPITCTQKVFQWGFPGVTSATCRIFTVRFGTHSAVNRSVYLADLHIPFEMSVVVGTMTPPPNPEVVTPALAFRAPVAAQQVATISESNYGNRTTNPAQVYTIGSGCAALATVTPANPVVPVTSGNGDASLGVLPMLKAAPGGASCGIAVTDNTPQTQTINVTIGDTYVPSATGTAISFGRNPSYAPVTIAEQNYDMPPPIGRGGIGFAGFLPNGSVPVVSGYLSSTDPNGICTGATRVGMPTLSGAPQYTETETWNVAFQKPGICWPVFEDQYGQLVEPPGGVSANANVTVVPTSLVYPAPGEALFYDPSPGAFFSGAPTATTQETSPGTVPAIAGGGAQSLSNGMRPASGPICVKNCHTPAPATPNPCGLGTCTPSPTPTLPPYSFPVPALGQNALCPENVPVIPGFNSTLATTLTQAGLTVTSTGGGNGCDYGGPPPAPTSFTGTSTPNAVSVSGGSNSDSYTAYPGLCVSKNIASLTPITGNATGPGPDFFGMTPVNSGSCTVNVTDSSGSSNPAPISVNIPSDCASPTASPANGALYCLYSEVISSDWGGSTNQELEAFAVPAIAAQPYYSVGVGLSAQCWSGPSAFPSGTQEFAQGGVSSAGSNESTVSNTLGFTDGNWTNPPVTAFPAYYYTDPSCVKSVSPPSRILP
ncbi:MAG: hypothetical protein ACYDHD_00050 [Vulcanimicrobiaceae bacterium]